MTWFESPGIGAPYSGADWPLPEAKEIPADHISVYPCERPPDHFVSAGEKILAFFRGQDDALRAAQRLIQRRAQS